MTDDITQLRSEIDAIDDQLIALLNERSRFVRQVGGIKRKTQQPDSSFIRAGREAEMVRRIAGAFKDGVFPAAAAAHIWRIIISASLSLESELTVAAFANDQIHDMYWLAREYFGNFVPITRESTARRTLAQVIEGKAQVAVLPQPGDSTEGKWWLKLPDDVRIFACIPFVLTGKPTISALSAAKLEPEPTGDDVSLFSIETVTDLSQSRLKSLFDKYQLATRWLALESFPSGHRAHLVELKGFVGLQDAPMQAFVAETGASLLAIKRLGAYAVPLSL